jgi:hypothetical protein
MPTLDHFRHLGVSSDAGNLYPQRLSFGVTPAPVNE